MSSRRRGKGANQGARPTSRPLVAVAPKPAKRPAIPPLPLHSASEDAKNASVIETGSAAIVSIELSDIDVREQLRIEQKRRRIFEGIARNVPLSQLLDVIAEMVERECPALRACVLVRRETGAAPIDSGAPQPLPLGLADSAYTPCCLGSSHRLGEDFLAVIESLRSHDPAVDPLPPADGIAMDLAAEPQLAALLPAARREKLTGLWVVPATSQSLAPAEGVAPSATMYLFTPELRTMSAAERAVVDLAAELIATAVMHQETLDRLALRALHDPLTGLPTRFLLQDRLIQAVAASKRTGVRLAVYQMDIQDFQQINGTLGHDGGDDLLRLVAARLRSNVRQSDTLARVGGDEFLFVAAGIDSRRDAARVGEKLLRLLKSSFRVQGRELYLGAAIGVAIYPQDGANAAALQRSADAALQRAKQEGGGRVEFPAVRTEGSDGTHFQRLDLEGALRQAVEHPISHGMCLHYQPQVEPAGRIIGFEALMRWTHPHLGRIPPDQFIPIAERTSLILPLGDWVMWEACRQAKEWRDHLAAGVTLTEGATPSPGSGRRESLRVAVNVSGLQFAREDFPSFVERVLRETGLSPQGLELELTETVLMHNTRDAAAKINRLREMGVAVAIDDFGTGYSSLAYLHRLPIDTLKIDRSFVHSILPATPAAGFPVLASAAGAAMRPSPPEAGGMAVIRAIISMAHSLHMDVLAEGVETPAQRQFLWEQGCRLMQGYLFGRPISAGEARSLLERDAPLGCTLGSEAFSGARPGGATAEGITSLSA